MSENRAHEREGALAQAEAAPDVPQPATVVPRVRSISQPSQERRSPVAGKDRPPRARKVTETKPAVPARLIRFLREVVSELSKVIWPNRRELVVYTAVVLAFVSFMVAFVALLDMGLGRAVLTVFG
ncbi:MAG: preprotein translocase subunit SecE [Pseudonocardiales bacterium]|nr:preprotein translocase subunit SecE [Pseudonocardiales bacterium]